MENPYINMTASIIDVLIETSLLKFFFSYKARQLLKRERFQCLDFDGQLRVAGRLHPEVWAVPH